MRCLVCDNNNWENIDQFRLVKKDMCICKECGFISYPKKYKTKEEIIKYYRKEYRAAPNVGNVHTGTNKLHYHANFLSETIEKWQKEGKKNPVIGEVGSAFGMYLSWFKNLKDQKGNLLFPEIDVNGTELTLSFRRVAYHEFGIDLKEDFDDSKKYDLISSYKVAEHQIDVDKEFERYYKALNDDGLFYVSVPVWHRILHNFGCEGFDIEYYYHPDHINVWEQQHFRHILNKTGFKIIKEDHAMYDSTYLCRKIDYTKDKSIEVKLTPVADIRKMVIAQKEACDLFIDQKYKEALEVWGNFPIAWRGHYEMNKATIHKQGYAWIKENLLDKQIEGDIDSVESYQFAADVAMRYDKFEDALGYLKTGLEKRPNSPAFLANVGNCYRAMAKNSNSDEEKIANTIEARQATRYLKANHMQTYAQTTNWIFIDHSNIPMPSELI